MGLGLVCPADRSARVPGRHAGGGYIRQAHGAARLARSRTQGNHGARRIESGSGGQTGGDSHPEAVSGETAMTDTHADASLAPLPRLDAPAPQIEGRSTHGWIRL